MTPGFLTPRILQELQELHKTLRPGEVLPVDKIRDAFQSWTLDKGTQLISKEIKDPEEFLVLTLGYTGENKKK